MEKTKTIGVRVSLRNYNLMKKVAEERGTKVSSIIRQLIRRELAELGYLGDDTRKALGLKATKKKFWRG